VWTFAGPHFPCLQIIDREGRMADAREFVVSTARASLLQLERDGVKLDGLSSAWALEAAAKQWLEAQTK